MDLDTPAKTEKQLSRWISLGILLAAIVLGLAVLYHANHSPRTDDAEVFANFIGIAPQVEGPIVRLNVQDNQVRKEGRFAVRDRRKALSSSTPSKKLFPIRLRSKARLPTNNAGLRRW